MRHRVAVGDIRMADLNQVIGELAESVVRHRRRNGLKSIAAGNAVVVKVVAREALQEHTSATGRPRLCEHGADLRRGGIAEAEVHRRRRVGRIVEANLLLAVGRERRKLRGVGKAVGLDEEEAELDAVRLERGGERVGVGRRFGRDGRDFGEVVPGVLVSLAVNRAGCDVELVRSSIGVAEGERHRRGRGFRHGHRTTKAKRRRGIGHAAEAGGWTLRAGDERRCRLALVEHVV